MTDAEVITTALIAAIVFSGNIERAKVAMYETGLIPICWRYQGYGGVFMQYRAL